MKTTVSLSRLRELLRYAPDTGQFTWLVTRSSRAPAGTVAGHKNMSGYVEIRIDSQRYLAHRLAWLYTTGEWPAKEIDHINRDAADNRFANLREATRSQNACNMPVSRSASSMFRGVCWCKKNRTWNANIRVGGVLKNLGRYKCEETAAQAYDAAARSFHGKFAQLNFEHEAANG